MCGEAAKSSEPVLGWSRPIQGQRIGRGHGHGVDSVAGEYVAGEDVAGEDVAGEDVRDELRLVAMLTVSPGS